MFIFTAREYTMKAGRFHYHALLRYAVDLRMAASFDIFASFCYCASSKSDVGISPAFYRPSATQNLNFAKRLFMTNYDSRDR